MRDFDYSTVRAGSGLQSRYILGMRVDATSYGDAAMRVARWAKAGESRFVCIASVNNVMEAHDDHEFLSIMNDADLVTPDGMPLVWGLRRLGLPHASRVYGPDLTPAVLTKASEEGIPVGFYGGSPGVLEAFLLRVERGWPNLRIAYAWSPPFRDLTDEEDERVVEEMNASGARMLFVGIGCPRQEIWMSNHRGRVDAVMLGVGAASGCPKEDHQAIRPHEATGRVGRNIDNSMLNEVLGWEPQVRLEEGLKRTCAWIESELQGAGRKPHASPVV